MAPDPSLSPSPHLPLRERKKLRTRHALAATALELFTERGFDDVTLSELVDKVEISKRTFFRHFASKEDVAIAAEAELWDAYLEELAHTELAGSVLTALHATLISTINGMGDDWERRFLATRRLIAGTAALRKQSTMLSFQAQERLVEELERQLGTDSRWDVRLRLLGEFTLGVYRCGAKNWSAGRGEGGDTGYGRRTTLARRVQEAFAEIPRALDLTVSR
ncbi:TetR family transcriptional regulator [Streptomyces sp. TRM70350]|uniref:TetR family transcriptional regulator n=1 Tax=Streptomyces sp. TRM70350 TaxID=2856165 RepID=UPI001C4706C2|nr:TetR family transcriptional regulator [Streptomyces sp. TRM70350]MBV7697452.1 TetR/AcrR family transcriptional regulator [Streptomyces sp. TRM70350]